MKVVADLFMPRCLLAAWCGKRSDFGDPARTGDLMLEGPVCVHMEPEGPAQKAVI